MGYNKRKEMKVVKWVESLQHCCSNGIFLLLDVFVFIIFQYCLVHWLVDLLAQKHVYACSLLKMLWMLSPPDQTPGTALDVIQQPQNAKHVLASISRDLWGHRVKETMFSKGSKMLLLYIRPYTLWLVAEGWCVIDYRLYAHKDDPITMH